ncbi:MraY family glycosyltransferase [Dokdonella sp.]|uniref:MraY family glycosyltransferase n=1 Tax=Dokdonella sp. TaxID=2291710 RepID=UPI002F40B26A
MASFLLTFVAHRLLEPVAWRYRLLDHPGGRKDHACTTPVTGGIAMLVGVLLVGTLMHESIGPGWRGFALASMLLVIVGFADDRYDLPWAVRLLAQATAALIMIFFGGLYVDQLGPLFGSETVFLGALAVPFTVIGIVGVVNAVNMIDGADGVAGMLVLSTLVMFEAAATYVGDPVLAERILILIGAVSAFLACNLRFPWRRRARAFMGNAGSGFLGLVVAWIAIRLTEHTAHPVAPVLMPWLVAIPLMDCLVLMIRRTRAGRSPFSADHGHIHHLMLEAGFRPTGVAILLAFASGILGLVAGLAMLAHVPHPVLLVAFVLLCAAWYWLTSQRARAVEFFRGVRGARAGDIAPAAAPLAGGAGSANR